MAARLPLLALALLASCSSAPTRAEVESADRGPMPDGATAESAARWVLGNVLFDRENSRIEFRPPVRAGYRRDSSDWRFCWVLEAEVTDLGATLVSHRNAVFEFYFRDDRIEAFSNTFGAGGLNMIQLVVDAPSLDLFRQGTPPEWKTLKDLDEP